MYWITENYSTTYSWIAGWLQGQIVCSQANAAPIYILTSTMCSTHTSSAIQFGPFHLHTAVKKRQILVIENSRNCNLAALGRWNTCFVCCCCVCYALTPLKCVRVQSWCPRVWSMTLWGQIILSWFGSECWCRGYALMIVLMESFSEYRSMHLHHYFLGWAVGLFAEFNHPASAMTMAVAQGIFVQGGHLLGCNTNKLVIMVSI